MNRIIEWDDAKDEANYRKHGIRFEEAAWVFDAIRSPCRCKTASRMASSVGRPLAWSAVVFCYWSPTRRTLRCMASKRRSFASFPRVARIARKGNAMSRVRHEQGTLPAITPERMADMKALAQQSDASIDYSDIPSLDAAAWQGAVRNPFYRPNKTHTTVRVDADVLAWLKSQGKGYQTRLNAILRQAMLKELRGPGSN